MALPPEARLLLALGKPAPDDIDREGARAALSDPAFRWPEAVRLAGVHSVQAMLAWNLRSDDAAAFRRLPHAERRELEVALLAARTRRAHYHAMVAPVFERLKAQGIPVALMKGAVVTEMTFPADARWLNDLDVLVPVEARSAAVDAFVYRGFRLVSALPEPDAYHQVSLAWEGGDNPLCVDLHWDIYPRDRPFAFNVSKVLDRAHPVTFGGAHVLGMSPADTLVHYATQLPIDSFKVRLGRFCDIHSLLTHAAPDRILDVASESGAAGITHTALSALSLLGARVPVELLDSLAWHRPGCTVGSHLLTDYRWLIGGQRPRWGAQAVVTANYLPSGPPRRQYWRSVPRTLYRNNRRDHSSLGASLRVARLLLSLLVCGSVLRLPAVTGTQLGPPNSRRRRLLWRAP